jgi:23S rRNA pseudouridine1911/1915/1917 synthase
VRAGEWVTVERPAPVEPAAADRFEVLHEDAALLVIDKPAHLPVHPSARYHAHTLTALMRARFGEGHGWEMAHRLDRETSGAMVFGRRGTSGGALKRAFQERRVHKEYLAIVHGPLVARVRIDAPIGPALASRVRIKMGVRPVGLPASTEVEPLAHAEFRGRPVTLVRAVPHTGRQHQIRVHLAHLGHAVLGDKLYGFDEACFLAFADHDVLMEDLERALGLSRHALHAHTIALDHPQTGARVSITAPWPAELAAIVAAP